MADWGSWCPTGSTDTRGSPPLRGPDISRFVGSEEKRFRLEVLCGTAGFGTWVPDEERQQSEGLGV